MKRKGIIFFSFLMILVGASFFFNLKNNSNKDNKNNLTIPTETVVPTISSDVKVNLNYVNNMKDVFLTIDNIPKKTNIIEYIITYETEEGALQGVNGTIEVKTTSYEKKITLGTCSSGTCVYHQVKGKIKLELIFKGDFGQRYFSREY